MTFYVTMYASLKLEFQVGNTKEPEKTPRENPNWAVCYVIKKSYRQYCASLRCF